MTIDLLDNISPSIDKFSDKYPHVSGLLIILMDTCIERFKSGKPDLNLSIHVSSHANSLEWYMKITGRL